MKKPGNNRFVQWNNVQFTSCTIAWNKVAGASAYQIRGTWTDGSHADSRSNGYVDAKYNAVKLNGLHYQHVYYATVRAVKISNGRITSAEISFTMPKGYEFDQSKITVTQ